MRASRKTKLEFSESNHLITKHRGKHLAKCSAKLRKFSSLGSTVVYDSVSPSAAPSLQVGSLTSGVTNSHGVTGGVYKTRERIHRSILICDY